MAFSKDFLWGAASAAHQIEGAYNEDGKGLNIWDALCEGKIEYGDDGKVHDPQRIDYVQRHLRWLKRATEEGVPIIGYQYWSIMDNFEWSLAYSRRFGLIYIDYRTQERTLKDSAYYYAEIIKTNGENL